jgi:hypothetical protein
LVFETYVVIVTLKELCHSLTELFRWFIYVFYFLSPSFRTLLSRLGSEKQIGSLPIAKTAEELRVRIRQ